MKSDEPLDYAAVLIEQNELFGDLVGSADPSTPVPTCPGWSLQQLFRHVGRGDRWSAQIVADRMDRYLDPRTVRDGKPPADPAGALEWSHGGPQTLIDAVRDVGPDTPVWTFLGPRPAAWWIRRRLHEATVHRADAAIALGTPYDLSPELAADCISEMLDLLAAGRPGSTPPLDAGSSLHLHATDEGLGSAGEWSISAAGNGVSWDHAHTKGAVAVRGRAVDLMLAFVRRVPSDEAAIEVLGEQQVWADWLERTAF